MNRRTFVRAAAGAPLLLAAVPRFAIGEASPYGALQAPDAHGLMLPAGFRARVIGVAGEPVAATSYEWHVFPDGGATFAARDGGGWVYVSNSEVPNGAGGASAIRFSASGEVVDAYRILEGTSMNCAGGATPWGTWISCEEVDGGRAWECDPFGGRAAVVRPALGAFPHEAVAVDPERRTLYLTEDQAGGRLRRFTPARWEDLSDGTLEAALVADDGSVTWVAEEAGATPYDGGEGIAYRDGHVVFTTKGDQRIRDLDVQASTMSVLYEGGADPQIVGPDNVAFSSHGDLYVCEDTGAEQDLVLIAPDGGAAPVLRLDASHAGSELAGVAFDPSGTRLYVSSQRGAGGVGVTFEVTGPWRRLAATTTTRAAPTTTSPGSRATGADGDDDDGNDDDGNDLVVPAVGVAGAAALAIGGLAWWRARRGSPTA